MNDLKAKDAEIAELKQWICELEDIAEGEAEKLKAQLDIVYLIFGKGRNGNEKLKYKFSEMSIPELQFAIAVLNKFLKEKLEEENQKKQSKHTGGGIIGNNQ